MRADKCRYTPTCTDVYRYMVRCAEVRWCIPIYTYLYIHLIVICTSFWGRFSSSPIYRSAQVGVSVWYDIYPLDMYTQYLTWDGVLMFCADILTSVVWPQFQQASKQTEWPSSLNNFWQTSSHILNVLPLVGFMLWADMMVWVPGLETLTMVKHLHVPPSWGPQAISTGNHCRARRANIWGIWKPG